MSEELKGQLAEGIPGAVDVFVKALQKTQNNVNLTTKDLFKMMEEGKLMSKDILPAVADEFKALARNGGALDKAVNSNRASFQRLKTAMQASMGEFFDGGFGSALTTAFDTISAALNNNADTFKFWGGIAGNVIDGATDAFAYLYDTIVFVASVGGHYLEQMGIFRGPQRLGRNGGLRIGRNSVCWFYVQVVRCVEVANYVPEPTNKIAWCIEVNQRTRRSGSGYSWRCC